MKKKLSIIQSLEQCQISVFFRFCLSESAMVCLSIFQLIFNPFEPHYILANLSYPFIASDYFLVFKTSLYTVRIDNSLHFSFAN